MRRRIGNGGMMLSQIAAAAGGRLYGQDRPVESVCTDSREVGTGTESARVLFVALVGARCDGHQYVESVCRGGCRAVLCQTEMPESVLFGASAVVTANTEVALAAIAGAYLEDKTPLRVAVTGSVGKTTTKEMTASVLSAKYATFKTEENFNSVIGMPISALTMTDRAQAGVFEMGMSARGEIERLSNAVKPSVAVITNVGSAHLEMLGSRENIARAKLEVLSGLRAGGVCIADGDEPLLRGVSDRIIPVSSSPSGAYFPLHVQSDFDRMETMFDVGTPYGILTDLRVGAVGTHMVRDAVYAVAVGLESGLSFAEIRRGLAAYQSVGLRQKQVHLGGVTVTEDCYNASPESMRAALGVLSHSAAKNGGRAVAVLGDMLELGRDTQRLHAGVGAVVAASGVSEMVTLGSLGAEIGRGAVAAGMAPGRVHNFPALEDLTPAASCLADILRPGDSVLLKASRGVRAERIMDFLPPLMGFSPVGKGV